MEMEKVTDFFNTLICKFLFPHTVELARRGKYREAEESIRFILNHDSSPEYFLFLGKVYAQQGRYEEAIVEWKKVLEINPNNHEAVAAIQKAEESKRGILPSQLFKWKLIVGGLVLLFVLSIGMGFFLWKGKKNMIANNQALLNKYNALNKDFQKIKEEMDMSKKYQDIVVKHQNLEKKYGELERRTGEQLVIGLNEKINNYLAHIKGLSEYNFKITINKSSHNIHVHGEIPTLHLKKQIEKVIEEIEVFESMDVKGLKVTHKYTVSRGDTLGMIAGKLYGDIRKWKDIYKANQNKINNPHVIKTDITLYIP